MLLEVIPVPVCLAPTTWYSMAPSWAAARSVSTVPSCRNRCSGCLASGGGGTGEVRFSALRAQIWLPAAWGLAFGLDRLVMLLAGAGSIREVMAFPKTQTAACMLTSAPSEVSLDQLRELSIRVRKPQAEEKSAG